ncbi:OmpA family protein [Edaphobacter aggregans]|uniref:OmpA family protein n=1 Tax=Edaphobacter aggregans TaxID=570835 RepID=UPI000553509E|nr:OmpA family protein [Edaphobacter aggregans]
MADSIIESVMSLLGPQIASPLAAQMGESTDTVQRGLQGGAEAMLSGLAARADEPGFLGQIFGMITNPANTPAALTGLTSNLETASGASPLSDLGGRFLSTVFGSRMDAVTDAVSQFSGLGAGKANTLLRVAATLVMGALCKYVRDNNMSPATLGSALKAEAPGLQRFLPAEFRSIFAGPSSAVAVPSQAAATTNKWLWPVVLVAALLLAGLWFFNRAKSPVQEAGNAMGNAATSAMSALGEFFKTKLPNGVELNIPQFGIENKLLTFIQDPSKPVDDTTWFNFDRLLFNTGKATLEPSSDEQLNNIAEILKAYPNVHVKIGGYTDNTGDPAANKALSDARAKNVMNALVAKGVDASRMEAEGYGDQYPVGDNSTEEGRAQNRRIALRVTQK